MPDFSVERPFFGYDYYIFLEGTRIKAKNGKTGSIDFSHATNADNVIQSCCNALSGGGVIRIGVGTFDIFAQVSSANVVNIIGSGRGRTTLRRQTPTGVDLIILTGSNLMFSNLTIDGNYPTNTSTVGTNKTELNIQGNNVLVENIEIKNFAGQAGIVQYGQQVTIRKCKIFGVSLINKSGWGILPYIITNPPITYIQDCWIEGVWINAIFGMGITTMDNCYFANNCLVNGGQVGSNTGGDTILTKVINCTFEPGLGNDYGIECEYGDWIVTGNKVRGNVYGIIVHNTEPSFPTKKVIIANNIIQNNNFTGIGVNEALDGFIITGNTSFDDRITPLQGEGIRIGISSPVASDKYIITNNRCYGNTTAQIRDLGTGTNKIINNNITT